MLITLEGADGSGKTTLCNILAEQLGAIAYATPPKKYLKKREWIDKNASAEEHYRFYRDGIYDANDEISILLEDGETVVTDRCWLTTYTYHQVMGVAVSRSDFDSIIQPDLTILLVLNHDIQIKRMCYRGISAGDQRVIDKQREIVKTFYQNALDFNIPFIVIDTQRFSPKECVSIISAALKV